MTTASAERGAYPLRLPVGTPSAQALRTEIKSRTSPCSSTYSLTPPLRTSYIRYVRQLSCLSNIALSDTTDSTQLSVLSC